MKVTRRARRRFLLLISFFIGGVFLVAGAWFLRQHQKESDAVTLRAVGLAAAEEGDWPVALTSLSKAVAFDKTDVVALLGLADARSRIPDGNSRHLTTAMTLYGRACDLARTDPNSPEMLQRALAGRARMELACGAIANLEDTSRELLGLSPGNDEAISYLLEINKVKGNILPGALQGGNELDLLIRGDRTDLEWLQAMRNANDESVFRWSMERLALDPRDFATRDALLGHLREGGAEDLQKLRAGRVEQSSIDLIAAWRGDGTASEEVADLLLASELIRDRDLDEARSVLTRSEARGFTQPELLLRAASLFDVLGSSKDKAASARLMSQLEEYTLDNAQIAVEVASRSWGAGKPREALELLDRAMEQGEGRDTLDLAVIAMAIAILADMGDADVRLQQAQDLAEEYGEIDDAVQGEDRFIELASIALKDDPSSDEVSNAYTIMAAMSSNPLLQTIFGDILANAGLNEAANAAWSRGGRIAGYRAIPIGQRAIRGYMRVQAVDKAFQEAFNYVSASPNLSAILMFCEAWLALDAAGIDPETVVPQLRGVSTTTGETLTPLALLMDARQNLETAEASSDPVLPLLARAALQEGRTDLFDEVVMAAIENSESATTLAQLIALDRQAASGESAWELLNRLKTVNEGVLSVGRIVAIEATMLRDAGRFEEASSLVDAALRDGVESDDRRLLELERLANLAGADADADTIAAQLGTLIGLQEDPAGLSRIHLAVLELAERDPGLADSLSQQVVDRTVVTSGEGSTSFALALARHVLEFDSGEDAVRNAILVVDPHTAPGGNAGIDLKMTLVALLQNSRPPQLPRAIEVMEDLLLERPGRFDIAVALTDLLQRDGRYDEAQERIQDLSRRREFAPEALQAAIPRLVAGQGDVEAVAESLCDFARQTGRTIDRLACARALFAAGDGTAGMEILQELRLDPDRPVEVDVEMAGRLVRGGRVEDALGLLGASDRFSSEIRRDLAVGAILLQLGRRQELETVLDRWSIQTLADHVVATPGEGVGRAERAAEAANMEVVRANHLLRGDPPDPAGASAALDRAVAFDPDRIEILVRNATSRLESPSLRATALPAIRLVATKNPRLAQMMELAFNASPDGERFLGDPELIRQAKEVVAMNPQNRAAYTLALQILESGYKEAMRGSDFSLITERYEDLVDMAQATMDRFPGDQESPILLSNVYAEGGEWDQALLIANEGANRAGRGSRIENVLPIAQIEVELGRYADAVATLEPFRARIQSEIARIAARPPGGPVPGRSRLWLQSWRLMVTALLQSGRVDAAWDLVQKMPPDDPRTLGTFIQALEESSAPIALEANQLVQTRPLSAETRLLLVGALNSVYRRTGDDRIRVTARSQVESLRGEAQSAARLLQLGLLEISLDEAESSAESALEFFELLDTIPPGVIAALKDPNGIPPASRQQMMSMFNPVIIVLNNAVAMGADSILSGDASLEESEKVLRRLGEASADLEALTRREVPEVNDTLSMAALAEGQAERALEFARLAVEAAPRRAGFRLGFAKALLQSGDGDEARRQALQARRLHGRVPMPDAQLGVKIEEFLQEVDSQG